jgi:hypothetical protein
MKNWTRLSHADYDRIWDRFYKEFSFMPSTSPSDWPSIQTGKPSLKISLAELWSWPYDETKWLSLIEKGIRSFVDITDATEEIISLDSQHDCYHVNPRKIKAEDMLPDENISETLPSFVPDGDYYIFMTKDFENVWFGHPWEKTITIIGTKLIEAYNKAGD